MSVHLQPSENHERNIKAAYKKYGAKGIIGYFIAMKKM